MSSAFPGHVFREYDIRGIAERDLSDELAYGIGRVFARTLSDELGREIKVAVGRDSRLSSPRLFAALTKGLLAVPIMCSAPSTAPR